MGLVYFLGLLLMVLSGYYFGRTRARTAEQVSALHSRPDYHGIYVAILVFAPMLAVYVAGRLIGDYVVTTQALQAYDPEILHDDLRRGVVLRDIISLANNQYSGDVSASLRAAADTYFYLSGWINTIIAAAGWIFGLLGLSCALRAVNANFRARNRVERVVKMLLFGAACVAVLTTVGILFSVLFETLRFFQKVSPLDFLFGLQWSPQIAMRVDQGGSSGAFGIVPLVTGTLLITLIAMLIAGPIGLFAAIYMTEYATPRFRAFAKPLLEILAGIPTVVLGFFAALSLAPLIRDWGQALGINVASESALAAGIVMGMMIIPFVSSLSDDVINAVPQSLRDGSLAMGATKSETIKRVVLPAALPGIVSAFMLAISRAVGETMIVVMAAGLAANLTFNPLEAVTTFTVQIKTILVGDQEFDSAKTLAAFALGFVLFFFTLTLNIVAMQIVKRYREQYD
jgi:phosphate transport system permease protein